MTKQDLQAKYFELYGEKPKPALGKPELEKLISDAENRISAGAEDAGKPGDQAGTESDGEINNPEKINEVVHPSKPTVEEIESEIKSASKVKDGKRHLVYKDGKEVWWTPAVIEVMYKSFGDRITFPENTQYILKNPKNCVNCG